jgi:hypothetical protein
MVSSVNSRLHQRCRLFELLGIFGTVLAAALMLLASASGSASAESNYSLRD